MKALSILMFLITISSHAQTQHRSRMTEAEIIRSDMREEEQSRATWERDENKAREQEDAKKRLDEERAENKNLSN